MQLSWVARNRHKVVVELLLVQESVDLDSRRNDGLDVAFIGGAGTIF
jgi:hypothetical protein